MCLCPRAHMLWSCCSSAVHSGAPCLILHFLLGDCNKKKYTKKEKKKGPLWPLPLQPLASLAR